MFTCAFIADDVGASDECESPSDVAIEQETRNCSQRKSTRPASLQLSGESRAARLPSASELRETLAHLLTDLAAGAIEKRSVSATMHLYHRALSLLPQETALASPTAASIMKQLGVLECCQGDATHGCHLLLESARVFRDAEYSSPLTLAAVWCELAGALLREHDPVTSLFEHVVSEVRRYLDDGPASGSFDEHPVADCDDSSAADVTKAREAMAYLENCFAALDSVEETERGHEYNALLVNALAKMGDCNVMTGSLGPAAEFYEQVLTSGKELVGSVPLEKTAHVLSMLGIVTFLLGNHPKAASLLQTAVVLQKHLSTDTCSFEADFTLLMLATAFQRMRQPQRSVVWCLLALDGEARLEEELDANHSWLVAQIVLTLGHAYLELDMLAKAALCLELGEAYFMKLENVDEKQLIQLLKVWL